MPDLPGVRVRVAGAADAGGIRRVVGEAFGPQEGPVVARLVEALDRAGHARASLVATAGEEVVGHVQLNRSWVDDPARLVEVLVLSPLSVAPAWQGRGVGSALLDAAVAEARHLGAPVVFLEGDPAFYGRHGWVAAGPLGFTKPSVRIPDAAFQAVVLDERGEDLTGALVYCDPFWALDCVGLR